MNFKSLSNSVARGEQAERDAKAYLLAHGLKLIEQNYACKLGEIDLIMEDKLTIVFVEVRFRKSNAFGGAAASVSKSKQSKITNTAKHWLVSNRLFEKRPVRFDVVAYANNDTQWIQGAF